MGWLNMSEFKVVFVDTLLMTLLRYCALSGHQQLLMILALERALIDISGHKRM